MIQDLKIGITINFDTNFYSNGLQQNVVFLKKLINSLENFRAYYIYEGKQLSSSIVDKSECFPYENILKNSAIEFDLIIMMGFTISEKIITSIKSRTSKTKFVLLQCGNQFIENMSFSLFEIDPKHSPIENSKEIDQIWTLPHYSKNLTFMKAFFKNEKVFCVPYIWDSLFIDYQIENTVYKKKQISFSKANDKSILIMEPNLFFSKNCILPLFIVESFEQRYPKVLDNCHVLCAQKLAKNDYFIKLIMQMDIYKKRNDFLKIQNRTLFIEALNKFPSILISHQQDNSLNYLYLEALYLKIPLLHNSEIISNYGYYYPENDIEIASDQLRRILSDHQNNYEEYNRKSNEILELYSTKNLKNISQYRKLLIDLINN